MEMKLTVNSPYDGSKIKDVDMHTADDVERMLQTAVKLFKDSDHWLKPFERTAVLKKLACLVEKEQEDFAHLIAKEGGKPLIDARAEVARAIEGIYLAIQEIPKLAGKEIPMNLNPASSGKMAYTLRAPLGIVVAVSAFNHPLNLLIHQVIPAIATGCPVIVKPASTTPLNCLRLVELIKQAGLPDGWCQAAIVNNQVAEQLVTDQRIAFFSFIGSGNVGWKLRSKLAPGVHCALEHGGAAPVIVDDTIDVDKVIPGLLKGGFYHAGQVCVSVQRIFASSTIAESLAKKLANGAGQLRVGDPNDEKTQVGPLISCKEVERVDRWVKEAIAKGATLLTGGKKLSDTLYQPTVLLNPPQEATLSREEIFGPIVCVYSYSDRLNAIELANSLPFAFQAAVYSNDINVVLDTVKRLNANTVMVNEHTAFRVDWMPFGGRGHSGLGVGGMGYSMRDMTYEKLMVIHLV